VQPAFVGLATAILPIVQMVGDWVAKNPQLTVGIIAVIGAVSALLVIIGGLGLALPVIITGFGVLGVTAGVIIPTILMVTGIITGLIATMYSLYNIIILLATDWKTVWQGIKEYIKEFIAYIKAEFADMGEKLKAIIGSVTTVFDPWIEKIKDAYNWVKKLVDKASELGSDLIGKISGKKATGGGVQVGNSYVVGEKGPEMFTPASNGSITPNYKMAGGGGMNLTINMNGGTYLDDNVAEKIGDKLIQVFKRTARI
jgi:phage-related protein